MKAMFSAKDILPQTLKKLGVKRQLDVQTVILHWPDIAGQDIAVQSRPTSAKGGVLFVAVKAPVWGHHLSMMKEQILAKIHAYLGQKLFDDIKFYAGHFEDYTNLVEEEQSFRQKLRKISLSQAQCMEVKTIAHAVSDGVLRYRLQRVMLKDRKRRELLRQEGWHTCSQCSALCPPDEAMCTTCSLETSRGRREEIRRLLADAPWLSFEEVNTYSPCKKSEYMRARQELVQGLLYRIDATNPQTIDISTLAMLLYRLTPDKIDQDRIDKTLRFVRRNRYVLASGR